VKADDVSLLLFFFWVSAQRRRFFAKAERKRNENLDLDFTSCLPDRQAHRNPGFSGC
jgi:hypothetical protein